MLCRVINSESTFREKLGRIEQSTVFLLWTAWPWEQRNDFSSILFINQDVLPSQQVRKLIRSSSQFHTISSLFILILSSHVRTERVVSFLLYYQPTKQIANQNSLGIRPEITFSEKDHKFFRYSPGNFLYCCWLFMSASLATQCDGTRTELPEGIGRVRQTLVCLSLSHTIVTFTADDSMLYVVIRHRVLLLPLLVWDVISCASVSWSCCRCS